MVSSPSGVSNKILEISKTCVTRQIRGRQPRRFEATRHQFAVAPGGLAVTRAPSSCTPPLPCLRVNSPRNRQKHRSHGRDFDSVVSQALFLISPLPRLLRPPSTLGLAAAQARSRGTKAAKPAKSAKPPRQSTQHDTSKTRNPPHPGTLAFPSSRLPGAQGILKTWRFLDQGSLMPEAD